MEKIEKYIKQIKLLYVEDDLDTRTTTLFLLEEFFENIIVAVDGQDGLNKFKENEINLVITDMSMPNMDGLTMSEHIKEIDKDIIILIFSAYNESDILSKSSQSVVDEYLLKPMNFEHFIEVIKKSAETFYSRQIK